MSALLTAGALVKTRRELADYLADVLKDVNVHVRPSATLDLPAAELRYDDEGGGYVQISADSSHSFTERVMFLVVRVHTSDRGDETDFEHLDNWADLLMAAFPATLETVGGTVDWTEVRTPQRTITGDIGTISIDVALTVTLPK